MLNTVPLRRVVYETISFCLSVCLRYGDLALALATHSFSRNCGDGRTDLFDRSASVFVESRVLVCTPQRKVKALPLIKKTKG